MYDAVADIERLIDAAKRAPSVLNTQPWLFKVVAGDRIELRAQPERRLQHIDPQGRELVISCGAALFNLRLALRVAGHDPVVWLLPEDEEVPAKDDQPDLLASVEIVSTRAHPPTATEQRLYEAIWRRRTNRRPFERELVGLNILAELELAARQERTYLWLLDRRETRKLLADIKEANRKVSEDPVWGVKYRTELRQYTVARRQGLGIPPEAFGPLPANSHVPYRDLGLEWHGQRERMRFEKHTRLLVLSTSTNRRIDWLRAGQGLQRVLLTAARLNVVASFYTQPLEPVNKKNRSENPWSLWPKAKYPQMIMRIGYCESPAEKTPRLDNDRLWEDSRTQPPSFARAQREVTL
ncbi:MAG TPA: nitroreductase family protein [Streptosporangiaceae bacterium]|nr:nitroreductase family protein [Streptosporangiaceae bacterium]